MELGGRTRTRQFLMALEDAWEEPPPPRGTYDHPVLLSPDWPPHSELDQAVYRIVHDRYGAKAERLHSLFERYGCSRSYAKERIKELGLHKRYRRLCGLSNEQAAARSFAIGRR